MFNNRSRLLRVVVGLATAATLFQFSGCSLADALTFMRDFNPVGSIITGNPASYRFLTSGYEGPGVNPDIDPFCTYPPYCPPQVDPIPGGGGP